MIDVIMTAGNLRIELQFASSFELIVINIRHTRWKIRL